MSHAKHDEYLEQMRELEACPYCRSEITRVGDLDYCGECEVITEGYTETEQCDERQPQEERDLYWWETLSAEDRKRHNEYREYLESIYARTNS